jgi:hypothetical protein
MVYETIALPLSYVGVSRVSHFGGPSYPGRARGIRAANPGCIPGNGTPGNL